MKSYYGYPHQIHVQSFLGRIFKRIDENGDKKLDFDEFQQALQDHGIEVDGDTQKECFDEMDIENTGVVNFDEFLIALRVSVTFLCIISIETSINCFLLILF